MLVIFLVLARPSNQRKSRFIMRGIVGTFAAMGPAWLAQLQKPWYDGKQ